jgi:hypothetical protein
MRLLPLALAAVGVVALTARADAQNYPWCAVYDTGDAAYNCGFVSYAQCMATVSGIGGTCMVNTQYAPPATPRPGWRSR